LAGKLTKVVDNLGIAGRGGLTFSYTSDNHLKDVTDWTGRRWSYGYDGAGNLTPS